MLSDKYKETYTNSVYTESAYTESTYTESNFINYYTDKAFVEDIVEETTNTKKYS